MNYFMEVAKLRAARLLWAKLMRQFAPKDERSLSLRAHCQTSGWSLAAQDVFNNVTRTCIEAMAATQGQTQSLHTNALDEALGAADRFLGPHRARTRSCSCAMKRARRVIDPWGGSFFVERLTHDLAASGHRDHIAEMEALGGMAKAIARTDCRSAGSRKPRRARRRRIDSGEQTVVGVNRYRTTRRDADRNLEGRQFSAVLGPRRSKNSNGSSPNATRRDAIRRSRRLRAAARGSRNLLDAAVDAARAKATVGEMSEALERVFGPACGKSHSGRRRLCGGLRQQGADDRTGEADGEGVPRGRGAGAQNPRCQDRPGWPRPRAEGNRLGLQRFRLRGGHR